MIHKKNDVCIFFSHIPRNGGRYVSKYLINNSFKYFKTPDFTKNSEWFVNGKEYVHLTYDDAKRLNPEIENMKKIAIFRNPISRFESICNSNFSMKVYFQNYERFLKLEDPDFFNYMMFDKDILFSSKGHKIHFKGLYNAPTNWFRHQREFFDNTFYIWKYENGLNGSFKKFLINTVGIDVNPNLYTQPIKMNTYDEKLNYFKMNDRITANVLNFYKDDYEYWKNLK